MSERFVDKMQEFLAAHGSDMIDAFLYGNLCQNEYKSQEDRGKLFSLNFCTNTRRKLVQLRRRERFEDFKLLHRRPGVNKSENILLKEAEVQSTVVVAFFFNAPVVLFITVLSRSCLLSVYTRVPKRKN